MRLAHLSLYWQREKYESNNKTNRTQEKTLPCVIHQRE